MLKRSVMNYTRRKQGPDPWQQIRAHLWPAMILFAITIATTQAIAQAPAQIPPSSAATRPGGRGGFAAAYPQRPPADPAVVARGKALYGVHCNFCHGSDARGGEGGPNLLRSELVLNDRNGELIAPVVQSGRGEMPRLNL